MSQKMSQKMVKILVECIMCTILTIIMMIGASVLYTMHNGDSSENHVKEQSK